jgi:transglutaminase-like putative cysteine protease
MIAIRSLTAVLTYAIGLCGMLPLFPWLTPVPRGVLLLGFIAGIWQDRRGTWPLKPWIQNSVIVPVFVYYALQFSRSNPVEPVVSVLAIMLAVRLGGEKSVRHSLQIYALSMFCLASSSLFDLSPVFLVYLGFLLFMVAVALVLLTFQEQDAAMSVSRAELKRILASGLLMPLLAVPLLLFFFPLMPRTQLPLWLFLSPPAGRSSGYSDTVEPGSQSSVTVSRTLVFRAELPRQAGQPYWRGTVFNHTDGSKWTRSRQIPTEQPLFSGRTVSQVIYPEPSTVRTLIMLDRPVSLSLQRVTRSPDGVIELSGPVGRRMTYSVESQTSEVVPLRNTLNSSLYLQLPERFSPRVAQLANKIMGSGVNNRAKIELLENYFRVGNYRYSTKGLATGDAAIEQFLFERKQGHCEFFASSFAMLLRSSGVPCRLVGGYLGGDYNELGGYYLVTEDKAHVWVEAYIEGKGWVRIDPSSFATNAGDVWSAPKSPGLKQRITLLLDSFNYAWNRSVISYDFEQQMNVAQKLGSRFQGLSPSRLFLLIWPYFAAGLLLFGICFAVRRAPQFRSREQRILRHFLREVERKYGVSSTESGKGLFELAAQLDSVYVTGFVTIYAGAVYRDRRLTDEEYGRLLQIVSALKADGTKIP